MTTVPHIERPARPDYTALDAAILERIEEGRREFYVIDAGKVREAAKALALAHPGVDAWRIVDRRLQALRKAGRIVFLSKAATWPARKPGWHIATTSTGA